MVFYSSRLRFVAYALEWFRSESTLMKRFIDLPEILMEDTFSYEEHSSKIWLQKTSMRKVIAFQQLTEHKFLT